MPIHRWWRLRKLVRDTTAPIPLAKAQRWDRRLGSVYNLSCFGAFVCAAYLYYEQSQAKERRAAELGIKPESGAEYWVRTLDIRDAKIVSIGGPDGTKTKFVGNPQIELKRPEEELLRPVKKATFLDEILKD